jgi:hypothetical protein
VRCLKVGIFSFIRGLPAASPATLAGLSASRRYPSDSILWSLFASERIRPVAEMLALGAFLVPCRIASEADESTTGPASLMLIDPDGNPVLIDQHIACPPKA